MSGRERESQGLPPMPENKTFVTGGGLPGNSKTGDNESIEFEDDEELGKILIKDVENCERDFKAMFDYLNDVDEMLCKDSFGAIQEMIDLSGQRVKNHISQYNTI